MSLWWSMGMTAQPEENQQAKSSKHLSIAGRSYNEQKNSMKCDWQPSSCLLHE